MKFLNRALLLLTILLLSQPLFASKKDDLYQAVKNESTADIKKILVTHSYLTGSSFDSERNTILMLACKNKCSLGIIDILIMAGSDVDATNKMGQTPLMLACQADCDDAVIRKLVTESALTKSTSKNRILKKDKSKKNAFDYAASDRVTACLTTFTPAPAQTAEKQPKQEPVQSQVTKETQSSAQTDSPYSQVTAGVAAGAVLSAGTAAVVTKNNSQKQPEKINRIEQYTQLGYNKVMAMTIVPAAQTAAQPEIAEKSSKPQTIQTESKPDSGIQKPEPLISEEPVQPQTQAQPAGEQPSAPVAVDIQKEKKDLEEAKIVLDEKARLFEAEELARNTPQPAPEPTEITVDTQDTTIPDAAVYIKEERLYDEVEEDTENSQNAQNKAYALVKNPDLRDSQGRTRLMNCIYTDDIKTAELMCRSGADTNAWDPQGYTCLMICARYSKKPEMVRLLLDYKADIKAVNNFGISVLSVACAYCQNQEILREFLKAASDADADIYGSFVTCLKEGRETRYIKEFLPYIKKINTLYKGKTPLMYAASNYQDTKVIKLLLEKGADPYIVSSEKKNAFSYAKENPKLAHDGIYWSLNVSQDTK